MSLFNRKKEGFIGIFPTVTDENVYLKTKQTVVVRFKDASVTVKALPLSAEEKMFISILEDDKRFPFLLMTHEFRKIVMKDDISKEDEDLIYASFLIN